MQKWQAVRYDFVLRLVLVGIFFVDTFDHMTAIVQKWGNSLAVRLPKAVADQIEVEEGQEVEMRVDGSSLVLKATRKSYKLSELLKGVTPQNRHSELDWGKPEGREVW